MRFFVYRKPDYAIGPFDADTDCWASSEALLGTTVRLERAPDVADDRRQWSGSLKIARSGPTAHPLEVLLKPVVAQMVRPAQANDFELRTEAGVLIPPDPYGRWPATIPAGTNRVTVRVVPKLGSEDLREYEVAWFAIEPNPSVYGVAPPGPWTTAVGPDPSNKAVGVVLWDGPVYRFHELSDLYEVQGGGGTLADPAGASLAEALGVETQGPQPAASSQVEPLPFVEAVPGLWPRSSRVPYAEFEGELGLLGGGDGGAPTGVAPAASLDAGNEGTLLSGEYIPAYWTGAYAINNAATASIAGYAIYYNDSYPQLPQYFWLGGVWTAPNYIALNYYDPVDYYYRTIYGVDDFANAVGVYNGYARYVEGATKQLRILPAVTSGLGGEALWLPPTINQPVGWSYRRVNGLNYARPTRWVKVGQEWTAQDLGSFDGLQTTPGYAYMNNDAGVTVGKTRTTVGTANAWRAFRTVGANLIESEAVSALALPPKPKPWLAALTNNVANGVNAQADAVGATDSWYERGAGSGNWRVETRAAVWWAEVNTNAVILGTILPSPVGSANLPGRSEALAANRRRQGNTITIVGTGWVTPTGYPRAFVLNVANGGSGYMLNLNDPQLTWPANHAPLTAAEAINDAGWIAGNCTSSGRGFVLVPQTVLPQ